MSEAHEWMVRFLIAWGLAGICYLRMRFWKRHCREADRHAAVLLAVVEALVGGRFHVARKLLNDEYARLDGPPSEKH